MRRPPPICLEDLGTTTVSVARLFGVSLDGRQGSSLADLAHHFLSVNSDRLTALGISGEIDFRREGFGIRFHASSTIGAVPLRSPVTGRNELGILVEPRFGWSGIGPALAAAGWRVVPSILELPLLPTSAKNVPHWVLATTILSRIERLLRSMERRFETSEQSLLAPRGRVLWARYAQREIAHGRYDRVPCVFIDLRHDRSLLGAIHWTLRKQLSSLEGEQRSAPVVHRILEWCKRLLSSASSVEPRRPTLLQLEALLRTPMVGTNFKEGIEAIAWTVEETGLAGQADLRGLPWSMSMEEFWEAWVETMVKLLVRIRGGAMRVGRLGETVVPIAWDPPYYGSQKSLRPDIVWLRPDHAFVFDAKYKRHWSELQRTSWSDLDQVMQAHHREDLLQILAYANVVDSPCVTLVLTYPCQLDTWLQKIRDGRGTLIATIPSMRRLRIALTGLPLSPEHLHCAAQELLRTLDPSA